MRLRALSQESPDSASWEAIAACGQDGEYRIVGTHGKTVETAYTPRAVDNMVGKINTVGLAGMLTFPTVGTQVGVYIDMP